MLIFIFMFGTAIGIAVTDRYRCRRDQTISGSREGFHRLLLERDLNVLRA